MNNKLATLLFPTRRVFLAGSGVGTGRGVFFVFVYFAGKFGVATKGGGFDRGAEQGGGCADAGENRKREAAPPFVSRISLLNLLGFFSTRHVRRANITCRHFTCFDFDSYAVFVFAVFSLAQQSVTT